MKGLLQNMAFIGQTEQHHTVYSMLSKNIDDSNCLKPISQTEEVIRWKEGEGWALHMFMCV